MNNKNTGFHKRDFKFIIIILCIVIGGLISALFCNSNYIRNMFSFGANLLSIVLAILAIVLSSIQYHSSQTLNANTDIQIQNMQNDLTKVSSKMEILVNNIVPNILKNNLNDLKETVENSDMPPENKDIINKSIDKKAKEIDDKFDFSTLLTIGNLLPIKDLLPMIIELKSFAKNSSNFRDKIIETQAKNDQTKEKKKPNNEL